MIQRAVEAGVSRMIVVGFNQETNQMALEYPKKYDFMYATLGVHPCDCEQLTDEHLEWMKHTAMSNDKVIAIGEMGLDYHHMSYSKEVQAECFRKQIRLAKQLDLPCIVHSRDAAEDTLAILLEEGAEKVIFHCYSYGYEFGKKVWEAGYYTSFSGVLTFPQANEVQEAARKGPISHMLIETDCPYLAPQVVRGQRNEIQQVVAVAEKLAHLRELPLEELAEQLEGNVKRLFPALSLLH